MRKVFNILSPRTAFWLAKELPDYAQVSGQLIKRGAAYHFLGYEAELLVVDGFDGLNPDAVAGLAGTVKQQGAVCFLVPPLAQWSGYEDPEYKHITVEPYSTGDIPGLFLQHLARLLTSYCEDGRFTYVSQEDAINFDQAFRGVNCWQEDRQQNIIPTADQLTVMGAVERVCTGHRNRPLVLTADRGRGKSAAIGMSLARLMAGGNYSFVATASSNLSVERLFFHCAKALGIERSENQSLHSDNSRLRYCPPDQVASVAGDAHMLIVDEAAAIGTPLLSQWLGAFSRIVFVTTVHGYEGSGQGFEIRFKEQLKKRVPRYKEIKLITPIRWGEGDVVETFINDAFLLKGTRDSSGFCPPAPGKGSLQVERLSRQALMSEEGALNCLFSLLVSAHYKTTPGDLRNMLDGPNLEIFVARDAGEIIGALLLAKEGEFVESLAQDIWQGRRRPRGHVMPQTLAVQCGYSPGLTQKNARVIRVAVQNFARKRGVGRALVDEARSFAVARDFDWFGSSFGATEELMVFWRNVGLLPVRVGITLDVASSSYSTLVLCPLVRSVEGDFDDLRRRYLTSFLFSIRQYYAGLSAELVADLLHGVSDGIDDTFYEQDFIGFIQYHWPYDVVFASLCEWFVDNLRMVEQYFIQNVVGGDGVTFSLLIDIFIRQEGFLVVVNKWGKGGEKALVKALRNILFKLNDNISHLHKDS